MATADESSTAPRRVRVERNIYRRASGVHEVGFKDGAGRQRWRTLDGGITAARAVRDELLVRPSRGERVASNARLRFVDAAGNGWPVQWWISEPRRRPATATPLPSERPKPGQSAKRRLFERDELEQTIAAAGEPHGTRFTLAALTGARVSELLAVR